MPIAPSLPAYDPQARQNQLEQEREDLHAICLSAQGRRFLALQLVSLGYGQPLAFSAAEVERHNVAALLMADILAASPDAGLRILAAVLGVEPLPDGAASQGAGLADASLTDSLAEAGADPLADVVLADSLAETGADPLAQADAAGGNQPTAPRLVTCFDEAGMTDALAADLPDGAVAAGGARARIHAATPALTGQPDCGASHGQG